MPAKATLYDNKGNINFDYGTGPRNTCHFNPQGTFLLSAITVNISFLGSLLMIAGFGNLRGKMECWDVRKKEKISEPEAPDTTNFHWSPGSHLSILIIQSIFQMASITFGRLQRHDCVLETAGKSRIITES